MVNPEDARLVAEAVGAAEAALPIEEHLVTLHAPTSFEAEQYLVLRHALEPMRKLGFVIAVSSPGAGDGKTTTAINLAGALAGVPEAPVLLVDADLRRPCVAEHLRINHPDGWGLADAILNPELSLKDVERRYSAANLAVLPAGRCPAGPYEALKSPRLGELLDEARSQYDYIVLDTPPLVPFPDCRLIGRWSDGFVVVVAAHKTPRRLLAEALAAVDRTQVLGLVFNGDDGPASRYYGAYYYGQSRSQRRRLS